MHAIGGRMFDVLIGIAALWFANLMLKPAPLAAALAWGIGLLFFWLRSSRSLWAALAGLLSGVALGSALHLVAHVSGRSTVPPGSLFSHLLLEAGIGFSVGALALAASLGRRWWRMLGTGADSGRHCS